MSRTAFLRLLAMTAASAVLLAGPGHAATLAAGYRVSAAGFGCSASGPGSGSITEGSPNCGAAVTAGSFRVSASGQASYDTLRASASAGFSEFASGYLTGSGLVGLAIGQASFHDRITLDVPGRTGEVVELVFTAAVSGSVGASADPIFEYAWASGGVGVDVNGVRVIVSEKITSDAEHFLADTNPGRVRITLGTPFDVEAELSTRVEVGQVGRTQETPLIPRPRFSASGSAAFANSGGITSFELFDLDGAPIPGYVLSSESGAFGFYAVPEPATAWLVGAALAVLGASRRRGPRRGFGA